MADTSDMAPGRTRRRSSMGAAGSGSSTGSATREEDLEQQIARLREDLKAIAASVAGLAEEKVADARGTAKREARSFMRAGQQAVEDATDEFENIERQIKQTIREKPLTAVAGAVALGFLLAIVTR